jgi:hypothetical protein
MYCFIRGIFKSFMIGFFVSGHSYIEIEDNLQKQILKCEDCGHVSEGKKVWGWH